MNLGVRDWRVLIRNEPWEIENQVYIVGSTPTSQFIVQPLVMETVETPVVPVVEEVIIEEGATEGAIEPLIEEIPPTEEATADEPGGETENVPPEGE